MPDTPLTVLFLCTGNSARSIIAEAILNRHGAGRFRAFSAGSQPLGRVNPNTLALLDDRGHDTTGLRSKSWDEFARPGAPPIDIIITVCDSAASEACPVWPGHPATAHWGIPDPAAAPGTAAQVMPAFRTAYDRLAQRIAALLALPMHDPADPALARALKAIGGLEGATAQATGQA